MINIPLDLKPADDLTQSLLVGIKWAQKRIYNHLEVAQYLKNKKPYLVTIILEYLNPDYYRLKKYNRFTKIDIPSHYDSLLFEYLKKDRNLGEMNDVYRDWIQKYDHEWRQQPEKYASVDELIRERELEPRYKKLIFKRFKNHEQLMKKRYRWSRDRYYHLPNPLNHIDWRNPFDNLFIYHHGDHKEAVRGGTASSGSRELNTIYGLGLALLSRTRTIPTHIFIYTRENELKYLVTLNQLVLPTDFGDNYPDCPWSEMAQALGDTQLLRWEETDRLKSVTMGKRGGN